MTAAELSASQHMIERVNELHQPVWVKGRRVCGHCRSTKLKHQPWPCDTARITRDPKDWGGLQRGETVRFVNGKKVWFIVEQRGETATLTDSMSKEELGLPRQWRRGVFVSQLRRV